MNVLTHFCRGFSRAEYVVLSLCIAALAYFGGRYFASQNSPAQLPPVFVEAPQEASQLAPANAPVPDGIMVHVAGAVRSPGVVKLPDGARVRDALHACGGATGEGDINSINLAAKLEDGQQVVVPRRGAALVATGDGTVEHSTLGQSTPGAPAAAPVNVNTASGAQLETLPGIGPALAARIIEARSTRPFRSLQDLDEVDGLGPKKLEKLQPHVTF